MMAVWRLPILVVSEQTANARSGSSGCSDGCNIARVGHIDRSDSPRLIQVTFKRDFAALKTQARVLSPLRALTSALHWDS